MPESVHPVRLIDQREVAAMYGVSAITINRWEHAGVIPKAHVDRKNYKRWLYSVIAEHIENMNRAQLEEAAS